MGILFALPAILGFVIWVVGPMLASLGIAFTDWSLISAPSWVGAANFQRLRDDPLFWQSLRVTAYYTVVAVPLNLVASFVLALFLNQRIRGVRVFRTIFYLPVILPAVATSIVWLWLFNPNFGILNLGLAVLHLPGQSWIFDEQLAIPSLLMLVPFFWMLSSSRKPMNAIFLFPPRWIPNPPRWGNYVQAMTVLPFYRYFINTFRVEAGVIAGWTITSALPADSFARLRWPGRDTVFYLLLSVLMLPGFVTLAPTFILWSHLHGVNTYWPLVLPTWFGNSFFIFLLRQFFLTIPLELEDAVLIDGAGFLRIFWEIIVPLVKPALAVVVIFSFMHVWNEFLAPLIYLNSPQKFTIALGLASFISSYSSRWDLLMAASTVTVLPMVLVFFLFQRYFVEGIALTGIKG